MFEEVALTPLKVKFREGRESGFMFTQIERTNRVALYHVTRPKNDMHIGYEVFFIRRETNKRKTNLIEKYPKDKDFGKTAFSFATLEIAKWQFEKLKKENEGERIGVA